MSKQDRQSVRTAAGLEQKYRFGEAFADQKKENAKQELTLKQFISYASTALETLQNNITSVNSSLSNIEAKNKELENNFILLIDRVSNYWQTVYPIGSIYVSIVSTSPETLFGGKWEKVEDRFLLGASNSYSAGSTGGEAEHTLTIDEMPSHNHMTRSGSIGGSAGWALYDINLASATEFRELDYIDNAGDGQPHNNMPPYLAVYMWKRTA